MGQSALTELNIKLQAAGVVASFIRKPTVPTGRERIRLALNVNHTQQDIDYLMDVLAS